MMQLVGSAAEADDVGKVLVKLHFYSSQNTTECFIILISLSGAKFT